MAVNVSAMAESAPRGFSLATEVADWLVRRGVPFRDAHEITGAVVTHCVSRGIELHEVDDSNLRSISPHLSPEVREVLTVTGALAGRTTPGSAGPKAVTVQLSGIGTQMADWRTWAATSVVPR